MDQNSQEWLDWRKKGIGASDAPVIMGTTKYKHQTAKRLWAEKTDQINPEKSNEFIKRKGHELESRGRAYIELITDSKFPPMLMVHPGYSFIRASLDGYNEEHNIIFEGKFIGKDDFDFVKNNKKALPNHYDQLQHQLMVTKAHHVIYCVYTNKMEEIEAINVEPDPARQAQILEAEIKFWERVQNRFWPENNNELSKKYCDLYQEIKTKEKELEELKEQILKSDIKEDDNIEVISKTIKGRVDYNLIIERFNINEDDFRKPTIISRSIKIKKGNL